MNAPTGPATQGPPWDDAAWVNWTGDLSLRPERHYYPTSLDDLCRIVCEAETYAPPFRVHAAGSRWAFCGPSATNGFVVETSGLNRTLETDITRDLEVDPASSWHKWGAATVGVYHVEAGILLHELCLRLDGQRSGIAPPVCIGPPSHPAVTRWALPTMGGSSGQTLAGALSTGVHGMDVHFPPLADAVRALHLIGPGGRQHWIERTPAITNDDALARTYPGIEIHRDDNLLAAAAVALGRFGIIYSVLLDVVPQFTLKSVTERRDWASVARELACGQILGGHRAVQVVISPYAEQETPSRQSAAPGRVCYLTMRDLASVSMKARSDSLGRFTSLLINGGGNLLGLVRIVLALVWIVLLGAWLSGGRAILMIPAMIILLLIAVGLRAGSGRPGDVVAGVCRWANHSGRWKLTSWIVRRILAAAERPGTKVGVGFQIMASPPWADEYVRGRSVEVFFDATNPAYLDVITDKLLPVIDETAQAGQAVAGWFSLRFMGRSRALLAMQRWERTVSVEVAVLRGIPGSLEVLRQLEATAVANGALVHWGQQHDLDADTVESSYPDLGRWRKQLRSICRNAVEERTFENDYCRSRGLTL